LKTNNRLMLLQKPGHRLLMSNGSHIQIKCTIVDDEPIAIDVIRRYVDRISRKRYEVIIIFLFMEY
jgi:hypothetical protein